MRGDLQKIEEVLPTLEAIDTSTIWSSDGYGSFREKLAVRMDDCYFCNYKSKNKDAFDIIRNIPEGATHTYFKAWDNKEIMGRFEQEASTDLELDSITLTPLYRAIPKVYISGGSYHFFLEGNFYKVVLCNSSLPKGGNNFTITNMGKEKPKVEHIVDITRLNPSELREVGGAVNSIVSAYREYTRDIAYDPLRYAIEKEVVKEVSEKYDLEYSLTKEEVSKMLKWQKTHSAKYHNGKASSEGASPVSYYEVKYGFCSIGSHIDCECSECKRSGEDFTIYNYPIRRNF